jgi:3-keto-disaccharide hydrolase
MNVRTLTTFIAGAAGAAVVATSILLSGSPRQGAPQAPARGGGFRQPDAIDFNEHDGWTSLFNGKTLNGWSGDSNWKVEDGAIVIESTCEQPTGTIYLVWQGGEAADFELKMEMKGTGNINSGIQYRSWIVRPVQRAGGPGRGGPQGPCPSGAARGTPPDPMTEAKWNMAGPQYDFDAANRYTGQFYEQATGRGIIAWKGQVVRTEAGKGPRLLATLGDQAVIDSIYKPNDWNQLHLIAVGNVMTHLLNGRVISVLADEDATKSHKSGLIGLEVESTGKLFARNIWLKKL